MRRFPFILIIALGCALAALVLAIPLPAAAEPGVPVYYVHDAAAVPDLPVHYACDSELPPPDYYTGIDFDTLCSNQHLTVLPLKSFQQQVTEYTCGPAAAMTVMSFYGVTLQKGETDEMRIADEMTSAITRGVNPQQMADWFTRQGWQATWGTEGTREMLRDNLKRGIPTLVEWIDWGGHWVVVVGYDDRGTATLWDDVIIFADSADCHDDRVDGITYFNYGRFEAMWFDAHYFPDNMSKRAYVVAVPAKGR